MKNSAKRCRKSATCPFSISLEGFEEVNDMRRGEGVFDKVMAAMDRLKAIWSDLRYVNLLYQKEH